MEMGPLVSVIVTTYRRPALLCKTLSSIVSQTYRNLEIIVIEDGWSDLTLNVINSFSDSRIKFFAIEHSGRPAVPRNFGLERAAGEFIAFCDDDDVWSSQKIYLQLEVFKENPYIKLCYSDYLEVNENDEEIEIPLQKESENKVTTTFESQLYKNNIPFSTVMIRKEILLNGLKFDERKILKASEDFLFLTQIVCLYPIFHINEKLIKYRIHQNGISYNKNSLRKILIYYFRIMICLYEFLKKSKISPLKFLFLGKFHFLNITKQILFLYWIEFKKYWRTNV